MKEVEAEDAEMLVQEAGWYSVMRPILSDSVPLLFGIFHNEEMRMTALLCRMLDQPWSHGVIYLLQKGKRCPTQMQITFELWNHRTELIDIVRCINSAGIHHGDLKPNNVCIDTHGKVRIIDWHLAEPSGCKEECMELAKFMDDIRCVP